MADEVYRPALLAVLGNPVKHSLSPVIHAAFAEQFRVALNYEKHEAGPHTLSSQLIALADRGARGCNITVPLKAEAWELAHEVSERAQMAQAVNTLVFKEIDVWFGDNTDGEGMLNDLAQELSELEGLNILLLGAGGAAHGLVGPLLARSPARLTIANRSPERAYHLLRNFDEHESLSVKPVADVASMESVDLIINATSMGHQGLVPDLPVELPGSAICYDLNYGAAARPLAALARSRGLAYRDGLGMLVEQAALSFELWFGLKPQTAPVLNQLRKSETQ